MIALRDLGAYMCNLQLLVMREWLMGVESDIRGGCGSGFGWKGGNRRGLPMGNHVPIVLV